MPSDDERFSDRPPDDRGGEKWEYDEDWERSRARRDDFDRYGRDDIRLRRSQMSWIDRQFLDTHMVLIVIVCLCCSIIMLPLGIVGVCTCQVPEARQKALVATILSGILLALSVLSRMAEFSQTMR
jgi:hypothetical protein